MDQDGAREPGVAVDEDTCTGDSGGPMIIPSEVNGQMVDVQVGIVSWGIGCASVSPHIFTCVIHNMNMVLSLMFNTLMNATFRIRSKSSRAYTLV